MASPIQIVLNPENYEEAREAGGGGGRKDFFAHRNRDFSIHRQALLNQLDAIAGVLSAQSTGPVGFVKVILRREAWAKSHRPMTALFQQDRVPVVGGGDLGVMIVEAEPAVLRRVAFEMARAEDDTRTKIDPKSGKEVPNPSARKSETGAIERIEPQWPPLASMTRQLVAALPDYSFSGPGMVPFARDIDNFWYKLSRIILTEASPQLYVRRSRWAGEVIAGLDLAGVNTSAITRKSLLRASNGITSTKTDGLEYLLECFDALFAALGIDRATSPMLVEHYDAFVKGSQLRIDKLTATGGTAIAEIAMFRKVFAEKTGITVSTIHGVKGAEYEAVIAFGLLEGMVPHFKEADKIEAANKLLYVICSRAKKNLHLISEVGRRRGQNNVYQPTDILLACSFGYDQIP